MLSTKNKILIIDSDAEIRRLLVSTLRKERFNPVEAANAHEAQRLIRSKTEFAALVLDLLMPNIHPIEFLNFIRTDPHLTQLPVLTVAANPSIEQIQECFSAGSTMFLPKPFTSERVLSAILILLNGHLKKNSTRRTIAA